MLTDITAALAPVKVFSEFVQRRAPAQMPALISQYHAMEQALGARSGDFAAALLRRVRARIGARLVERENLAIVAAAMHPDFAPTLLDSVSAELVRSTVHTSRRRGRSAHICGDGRGRRTSATR